MDQPAEETSRELVGDGGGVGWGGGCLTNMGSNQYENGDLYENWGEGR